MNYLRERLQHLGAQELSNVDLLSLALWTRFPGNTAGEHLHHLLTAYPTFHELLKVDFGQLASEYGLGRVKAAQLQALLEIARRLTIPVPTKNYQITSAADAASLVIPDMGHLDHEEMRVVLLSTKNHVLANLLLYQGTLNGACARIAEVFRPAITRKCSSIILCHNHPSESLIPSPEDLEFTKQCVQAGELLDIAVLDHLIIGSHSFLSLKEQMKW